MIYYQSVWLDQLSTCLPLLIQSCTLKNSQARKNYIFEWKKNKRQVQGCDGFGICSDDEWLLEMKIYNFLANNDSYYHVC